MSNDPIGRSIAHYRLTAKLGEGGMGEVYRATDSKLKRDVAIKLLPPAFTEDKERLARFEREAQLLAQLHHPNIASIFGIEESEGTRALVMELVEGPTLAERLEQGPLPFNESLSVALQIAQALEEAHEKGIVHRDLKPQNVKASIEGKVKVLDFGLAKAMDPTGAASGSGGSSQLAQSPTLTLGATQMGVILGTAAYMAPEQAVGGTVDRRADIWAFGVVLYEMLTGKRLFEGETVSHVLASVLKDSVDFSALPAETPERIRNLVRRCLRRKPRERQQSIGDARLVLEEVLADPDRNRALAPDVGSPPIAGAPSRLSWALAAAGLLVAVLFAVLWLRGAHAAAPGRLVQAALVAPEGWRFGDTFAISPDGSRLVFEAFDRESGEGSLWLRELAGSQAARLVATEGAEGPFWSPDGEQIAFFAGAKLKRIDPRGGPAQTICDAPSGRGGTWGPDGRIVFAATFRDGLSIVDVAGGEPKLLTTLDAARKEKSHRHPVFLPGGEAILFLAQTAEGGNVDDQSTIEALELASGKRTRLVRANASPLHAPGELLFWREGTLLAQRFDAGRLALRGEPRPVASPVAYSEGEKILASVSNAGALVYLGGARGSASYLVHRDRNGVGLKDWQKGSAGFDFALSHDGRRLAYRLIGTGPTGSDLWIHDLERDVSSRLTFEEGTEMAPVWSPDDKELYYASTARNDGVILRRSADGGAPVEVGTTDAGMQPSAASFDGRWLAVTADTAATGMDLFRFELATQKLSPLVESPLRDEEAAISPDDRLLAYVSHSFGVGQVYVRALSGGSGQWQVSTEEGARPRWRADGRELYYLAPGRVMAVEVEPGPVPRFSAPRELFRARIESFDVTPDGQQFVTLNAADSDEGRPLNLILGWTELLPK